MTTVYVPDSTSYLVEIVTKKNAKLIKRFRAADIKSAAQSAMIYLVQHPQYDAHVHMTLGKGGYVRVKVIKGKGD